MPDADELFPDDDPDFHKLVRRILGAQNNTVQAVMENGKVRFKVPGRETIFNKLGDAVRYRQALGMSSYVEYGNPIPGAPNRLIDMPTQGPMFDPFLETFAQHLSPEERLIKQAFHMDRAQEFQHVVDIATDSSFPVIDNEIATLTMLRKADGTMASSTEINQRMADIFGRWTDDASAAAKRSKRSKALTSSRPIGSVEMGKKYKVQVFTGELDERAYEGMGIINPRVIRDQAQNLEQRAAQMESELLSADLDAVNARQIRSNIRGLRAQAASLRAQASNAGGMFNIRMEGLDVVWDDGSKVYLSDPDGPFGLRVDAQGNPIRLDGQFKGNVVIGTDDMTADIITHRANIKTEEGMSKARFLTLDPRGASTDVFLDIQTLSANRDLFDVDALKAYTNSQLSRLMKEIEEGVDIHGPSGQGTQLGRLYHSLREIALESLDPSHVDYESALSAQRYAQDIITELDLGGGKISDPYIAKQLVKNYFAHISKQKYGIETPNFMIPDALRAEVMGTEYKSLQKTQTALQGRLTTGSVAYDSATQSWVMKNEDVLRFHHTFGGFDQDDTFVGLLRWDKASNKLKLVSYRNPNALGEIGTFDISSYDEATERVLRDRGLTEQADRLREIRQSMFSGTVPTAYMDRLEEEAARIAQTHIQNIEDLSAVQARSITGRELTFMTQGSADGKIKPREITVLTGFEEQHEALKYEAGLSELIKREMDKTKAIPVSQQLERARTGKKVFGKYMNARMVIDSILSSAPEGAFGKGVFSYISQETAIDFNILSQSGEQTLDELIERMYKQLGEQLAYARAGYKTVLNDDGTTRLVKMAEAADVGIDEYVANLNLKSGMSSVAAGIDIANQRLLEETDFVGAPFNLEADSPSSLLLKRDHPMSHIGRLADSFTGGVLAEHPHAAERAMALGGYHENIMREVFSVEEERAAKELIDTYRDSIRRNIQGARELTDDEIARELDLLGEVADRGSLNWQKVHADTLRAMAEFFEDDGTEGPRLYRVMAAAMQMTQRQHGSGHMFHQISGSGPDMTSLTARTKAFMMGLETESAADLFDVNISDRITRQQIIDAVGEGPPRPPGSRRAAARGTAEEAAEAARSAYKRFGKETVGNLLRIPGVKKGAIAAAGLVGFSAIYQKLKDRTPEDMAGPPLLPGGSAYEQQYAVPPMPPQLGNDERGNNSGGVTYRVVTSGDYDPAAFQAQAESIAGTSATGTIYNSRRRMNNVFDSINESF